MPRKNEPHSEFPCTEEIAQIFERCICFSKIQSGKQKREFRQKRKDDGPVSSYESRKPVWLQKKGLVRGEARVPGSSIRENVWTRLKFFRQIAVPVPVHYRASFEAGPKDRKFPFQ